MNSVSSIAMFDYRRYFTEHQSHPKSSIAKVPMVPLLPAGIWLLLMEAVEMQAGWDHPLSLEYSLSNLSRYYVSMVIFIWEIRCFFSSMILLIHDDPSKHDDQTFQKILIDIWIIFWGYDPYKIGIIFIYFIYSMMIHGKSNEFHRKYGIFPWVVAGTGPCSVRITMQAEPGTTDPRWSW